jgi:soluble P-type ATPase
VLALAAALEAGLRHPLAAGTMAAAEARGVPVAAARDVRVVPGRGVRGIVGDRAVAVGSPRLAADVLGRPVELGDDRAGVLVLVGDGRMLGTLRFREAPRREARDAIDGLRGLGVHVGVLTGDTSADAVVPALVAGSDVALGLLPEDKVAHLRALRGVGGQRAVAMVGDGINDAPALAAADVGIALAGATDLARLTADAVVLGGDLRAVPWLVAHARRVRRVVRQILAWAFAYNAGAVAVAAAGALDPVVASLAMVASSVVVVANARRLGRAPRSRSGHLGPRMTAPAVDPHGGKPVVPAGAPLGEALADPLRVEVEGLADAPEREHAGVVGREPHLELAEQAPPARGPEGGEPLEAPHAVLEHGGHEPAFRHVAPPGEELRGQDRVDVDVRVHHGVPPERPSAAGSRGWRVSPPR